MTEYSSINIRRLDSITEAPNAIKLLIYAQRNQRQQVNADCLDTTSSHLMSSVMNSSVESK